MPALLSQLTTPIVSTNPVDISANRTDAPTSAAIIVGSGTFEQTANQVRIYSAYNMTVNGTAGAYNTSGLIGSRLFVTAYATGGTLGSLFGYAASVISDSTSTTAITNFIGFNPTLTHSGSGTVSTFGGLLSNPTISSTGGDVTTCYGYRAVLTNSSATKTIANGYGLLVGAPAGTGAITTLYGTRVENMGRSGVATSYAYYAANQTGATTSWAFYQVGGQSYLAAGTATDVPLTIHGASSQSGNLQEWENSSSVLQAGISPTGVGIFNGVRLTVAAKTGAYTATTSDSIITGDTTSAGFTVTLPTAASVTGRIYIIKKIVAANTLTVGTTSGQTIDGVTTQALTAQWAVLRVASNGTNWITI